MSFGPSGHSRVCALVVGRVRLGQDATGIGTPRRPAGRRRWRGSTHEQRAVPDDRNDRSRKGHRRCHHPGGRGSLRGRVTKILHSKEDFGARFDRDLALHRVSKQRWSPKTSDGSAHRDYGRGRPPNPTRCRAGSGDRDGERRHRRSPDPYRRPGGEAGHLPEGQRSGARDRLAGVRRPDRRAPHRPGQEVRPRRHDPRPWTNRRHNSPSRAVPGRALQPGRPHPPCSSTWKGSERGRS